MELMEKHPGWVLDLQVCHNAVRDASKGFRRDAREALILAAIAVGAQTIDDIADETALPRTTVFRMLHRLAEKGLVEFRRGLYHRVYSLPSTPGI